MLLNASAFAQQDATTNMQSPLPDSPGIVKQSGAQQAFLPVQHGESRQPVGVAVAPGPNPLGIAASKPAGAAIAPAKQRRVRTILISMGAVLGAGVAIGTVAALSSASPSKPNGTR